MTKTYGYCRISTKNQSIERQERNIKELYPDAIILKEAYTGTKTEGRKEFEKLTKAVQEGDTIVFDSVSRMSRNTEEGVEQYEKWYTAGVNLVFLKEPYMNTDVYKQEMSIEACHLQGADIDIILKAINEYLKLIRKKQFFIAFDQAQKEVTDLQQRTKEGIQTARLNGKQIGQVTGSKLLIEKERPAKQRIIELSKDFDGTLKDADVMKIVGLARNTYYKYKKDMKDRVAAGLPAIPELTPDEQERLERKHQKQRYQ